VEKKGTQTSYPTKDELRFDLFEWDFISTKISKLDFLQ
jgi:hypothetical protein